MSNGTRLTVGAGVCLLFLLLFFSIDGAQEVFLGNRNQILLLICFSRLQWVASVLMIPSNIALWTDCSGGWLGRGGCVLGALQTLFERDFTHARQQCLLTGQLALKHLHECVRCEQQ